MEERTSVIAGLRDLAVSERRRRLEQAAGIEEGELARAFDGGGLDDAMAGRMVENAIGVYGLPIGVALNFRVDDKDCLVPMAIEEPSVIAAASHAAKRIREGGGFRGATDEAIMIAQIAVHDVPDAMNAKARIGDARAELLAKANRAIPRVVERGGGARDVSVRDLGEGLVVVHIHIDCRDAMGANLVNTVAETLGPEIAEIAGGELGLQILSNLCDQRCTRVVARVPVASFGCGRADGETAARGVVRASEFAERDPYRAATHNKGIMNGVDAVVVATGNDWRAVEAGAHAFAARTGRYGPLAIWRLVDQRTVLEGRIEIPLALGVVGGALRAHPAARAALAMTGAKTSAELATIAASAGLATNLAALRALATEGIQRGHMALHHRTTPEPIGR